MQIRPDPLTRSPQPTKPGVVPPHTPLTRYYDEDDARHDYVIDLFDRSARHYNTIEAVFLNGGLLYRRMSLWRAV